MLALASLIAAAVLAKDKPREPIIDAIFYDVAVIGGGAAEVTAAKRLAARGRSVILIDSGMASGKGDGTGLCDVPQTTALPMLGADLLERLYGPTETIGQELKGGDIIKVRLRARPQKITAGEHLVSVRYQHQGLPRIVRARTVLMGWKGDAQIESIPESGRLFTTSSLRGSPILRGHCAAANVLSKLSADWKPEDWPPCGAP